MLLKLYQFLLLQSLLACDSSVVSLLIITHYVPYELQYQLININKKLQHVMWITLR